jgi:hypothetical protein
LDNTLTGPVTAVTLFAGEDMKVGKMNSFHLSPFLGSALKGFL